LVYESDYSANQLNPPKMSITQKAKSLNMYDGAHLWNSIPKEIRESKTLSSFRNKIAAHKIDIE
jgi:hypothetical protein